MHVMGFLRQHVLAVVALVLSISGYLGSVSAVAHAANGQAQQTVRTIEPQKPLTVADRINHALIQDGFVGAVLVAQHGKILLTHGYGRAGLRSTAPLNTGKTLFNAGDLTVPLTASAVLQLAEERKLSVNDRACTYISTCPKQWKSVTIENLLDCTSGIYDPIVEDSSFMPTPSTTAADYIATAASHPLAGEPSLPDTGPCDSESIILGSIVQTVSGESFPTYIEHHVIRPAGLHHSGILQPGLAVPGMATPYGAGHTAPAGWIDGQWSYGLMGLYTTVRDMYRWDEALLSAKIVSQGSLHGMMVKHGQGLPYGFGLYASYRGKKLLVASGESPWSTAVNAIVPSTNTIIIFLSNTATNAPSYVTPMLGILKT